MLTRTHGSYPVGFLFYTNMATIRRQRRETPFVQIDKQALQDIKLSWKAKGLLAYLLSLPDDWKIYQTEISKHATDGKDSTNRAFEELLAAGYISKEPSPKVKGKFTGYDYVVSETRDGLSVADYPQRVVRNGESATTNIEYTDNKTNKEETKETPNGDPDKFKGFDDIKDFKTRVGKKQHDLMYQLCATDEAFYKAFKKSYKYDGDVSDEIKYAKGTPTGGRFELFVEFLEYRNEIKKPFNAKSGIKTLYLQKFALVTFDKLRHSIDEMKASGWQSIHHHEERKGSGKQLKQDAPIRTLPLGQRRRTID